MSLRGVVAVILLVWAGGVHADECDGAHYEFTWSHVSWGTGVFQTDEAGGLTASAVGAELAAIAELMAPSYDWSLNYCEHDPVVPEGDSCYMGYSGGYQTFTFAVTCTPGDGVADGDIRSYHTNEVMLMLAGLLAFGMGYLMAK